MNPAIAALLDVVKADPLPAAHTSSFWQRYGREVVVEQRGAELFLKASGFETVGSRSRFGRALSAIHRASYHRVTGGLESFGRVWRTAARLARDLGGGPSFHVFKSACALAVLADHWAAWRLTPRVFALIGDGCGFLGALIRRYLPGVRLYCLDLPKALVFQARAHELADPRVSLALLRQGMVADAHDVLLVCPQDLDAVAEPVDCAITIASMQEMTALSIAAYFAFLRRRSTPGSRFYCVNRAHKVLPGGEVIRFDQYPWQPEDQSFLDGPCPYYRHVLTATPLFPRQPRLTLRVPRLRLFGIHRHRLVHLAAQP